MTRINKAKRTLGRELRVHEGFMGVGVGDNGVIRLYARADTAPVVQVLRDRWGETYEGFPVSVVLSSGFKASSSSTS